MKTRHLVWPEYSGLDLFAQDLAKYEKSPFLHQGTRWLIGRSLSKLRHTHGSQANESGPSHTVLKLVHPFASSLQRH